jgi:polyhydroxyalkanoate synthase
MTALTDFSNPGELGVFIDEGQLDSLEEKMIERGFLEGTEMAETFNMLRGNDLIWSFVINNYLMGRDPFPFDLLHWNCDSTRMPARMHSYYLRNMYLNNLLREPGGITLDGVPIDLSKATVPTYFASAMEEHRTVENDLRGTAPLRASRAHAVARAHCRDVIRPSPKWLLDQRAAETADEWFAGATQQKARGGLIGAWLISTRAAGHGARPRKGKSGDRGRAREL